MAWNVLCVFFGNLLSFEEVSHLWGSFYLAPKVDDEEEMAEE